MNGDYFSLAGALLTVVCILALAFWCSRMLGKGFIRQSSGRNLKVVEQLQVGPDKYILLLKLQEHTYLVGVSAAGIQMLSEVDGIEITGDSEKTVEDTGFHDLMKKYASLYQRKKGGDK